MRTDRNRCGAVDAAIADFQIRESEVKIVVGLGVDADGWAAGVLERAIDHLTRPLIAGFGVLRERLIKAKARRLSPRGHAVFERVVIAPYFWVSMLGR